MAFGTLHYRAIAGTMELISSVSVESDYLDPKGEAVKRIKARYGDIHIEVLDAFVTKKEEEKEAPVLGTNATRVAVYGTLKTGHGNHRNYLGESSLLGRTLLELGTYKLVSLGGFPGIVSSTESDGEQQPISCEVYEVSEETLLSLDLLEGHPHFYTRRKVPTPYGKAWVYVLEGHPELSSVANIRVGAGFQTWRPFEEEAKWLESDKGGDTSDDNSVQASEEA